MKKRFLLIILSIFTLTFVVAGCKTKGPQNSQNTTTINNQNTTTIGGSNTITKVDENVTTTVPVKPTTLPPTSLTTQAPTTTLEIITTTKPLINILNPVFNIEKPVITNYGGTTEALYIKFNKLSNTTKYRVYYKLDSEIEFKKCDDILIREYDSYMRCDIVGLKKGYYNVRVYALDKNDNETLYDEKTIYASSYDRSGYGFVNGSSSGAYNDDGTLKDNAVVIYITEENKDSVKFSVRTSSKDQHTECTGFLDILLKLKKGYETRPIDFRVIGKITDFSTVNSDANFKGDICFDTNKTGYGITFEGIGDDATIYGMGIRLKNASNIEIRNIAVMMCNSSEGDNIGLQQDNNHIWVHNCDLFYGEAGKDSDQAKGDGTLDTKKSTYITYSYNHFFDSGKACLLGLSEGTSEGYYITYHHNWFDHTDSRNPRVRYYTAHVYNNYYDGISKYGIGSTLGSSIFSENNYFRNCKFPMLISMQGSDVYAGSLNRDIVNNPTFSKENGGIIKSYNNIIIGEKEFIPYNSNKPGIDTTKDFDAYVVNSRDEIVPSTVVSFQGSSTYNNFDTSSSFYKYNVNNTEDVPTIVQKKAGRLYGGDFKYEFNDSTADSSYDVDNTLKELLRNYNSFLKSALYTTSTYINDKTTYSSFNETNKTIYELIDEIGEVTLSSYNKIKDAYIKYLSLSSSDKENVTNYNVLEESIKAYNKLQVLEVVDLIDSITVINFNTLDDLKLIENKYNILPEELKEYVYNYSHVSEIYELYNEYETRNIEIITNNIINKINTIGEVTLSKQELINNIKNEYDLLKDEYKDKITNINVLENAINSLNVLLKIKNIEELAIFTDKNDLESLEQFNLEYNKLSSDERERISDKALVDELLKAYQDALNNSHIKDFSNNSISDPYFNITGNLSNSKGKVTYNGVEYSICLKMESATIIEFTTTKEYKLTLVFGISDQNVKIDEVKYTLTNGILTLSLTEGKHTITKANTANLYLIILE